MFKLLLRDIISFTFRWSTICGYNPNIMERLYSELAIKLRKNEIDIKEIRKKFRDNIPRDEEFIDKFKEKNIKNNKLAKYILLKINNYLMKKRGQKELTVDIKRVNLEHIIPRKPNREWLEFFKKKGIENWEELIYKIGNLTILLKEYNKRASNAFFTQKKEMYKESKLPLNEKLKDYNEFGPQQIEERAEEMANIAKDIWKV